MGSGSGLGLALGSGLELGLGRVSEGDELDRLSRHAYSMHTACACRPAHRELSDLHLAARGGHGRLLAHLCHSTHGRDLVRVRAGVRLRLRLRVGLGLGLELGSELESGSGLGPGPGLGLGAHRNNHYAVEHGAHGRERRGGAGYLLESRADDLGVRLAWLGLGLGWGWGWG